MDKKSIKKHIDYFLDTAFYVFSPLNKLNGYIRAKDKDRAVAYLGTLAITKKYFTPYAFNETLSLALIKKEYRVAQILLRQYKQYDINIGYRKNWFIQDPILSIACSERAYHQVIEDILQRTDDVNCLNSKGETPLMSYFMGYSLTLDRMQAYLVQDLIDHGARLDVKTKLSLNQYDSTFCNFLDLAVYCEQKDVIAVILKTELCTVKNIEHARYVLDNKVIGGREEKVKEIHQQLDDALIYCEKKQLENMLSHQDNDNNASLTIKKKRKI